MAEGKGHCLCGAVKLTVKNMNNNADACHCSMCRRWGGGPLMTVNSGQSLAFEGEENITVYNSSDWAERGFCKHCGSHLFYRLKENHEHHVPVGLFAEQAHFHFDLQVFIDQKPAFYQFANKTNTMTAAEVVEKYMSEKNP